MRSSVIKTDLGYRRHTFGTVITLDGEPVQKCITADEELGMVLCLQVNAKGVVEVDESGTGLRRITRHGVVVITPPKGQKKPKRRQFVRMFKPQFAPKVETGAKLQTVRPTPKRMPYRGDIISLRTWTGAPYRSKQRILRTAMITEVAHVVITTFGVSITGDRDAFARADGFTDFTSMRQWFAEQHGLPFSGIVIYWE